jgi:transcription factor E
MVKTKNNKKSKANVHKAAKAPKPKKSSKPQMKSKSQVKSNLKKGAKAAVATEQQKKQEALQKIKDKEKEKEKRKKVNVSIPQPAEVKEAIDSLLSNERAKEYLTKNVSKMAVEVVGMLVTPKTDEFLAEQLGMKINAIRRILNIMQGYGITNYYISKNTKGWLSFAWYINTSKLAPFLAYVDGMEREKSIVTEKCDDYFICESCYKTDMFVFTFDSAFESNFKCTSCGKNLKRMNRDEVSVLLNRKSST